MADVETLKLLFEVYGELVDGVNLDEDKHKKYFEKILENTHNAIIRILSKLE